jgi:hypothetical protein
MPEFNPEYEAVLHRMLKGAANATADKMFGFPVYRAGGGMAVSVKKEGIIARVGEKRADELIGKPGISEYAPLQGRRWKEWVLLTSNFDDYKDVFKEALTYTAANPK